MIPFGWWVLPLLKQMAKLGVPNRTKKWWPSRTSSALVIIYIHSIGTIAANKVVFFPTAPQAPKKSHAESVRAGSFFTMDLCFVGRNGFRTFFLEQNDASFHFPKGGVPTNWGEYVINLPTWAGEWDWCGSLVDSSYQEFLCMIYTPSKIWNGSWTWWFPISKRHLLF